MSLRIRLIALFVAVTATATLATAVLVNRTAAKEMRAQSAQSLADNAVIYQSLLDYAQMHPDWSQVQPTVRELADKYRIRIALVDRSGTPVADSASGQARPLPVRPAAQVDPAAPVLAANATEATPSTDDPEASMTQLKAVQACMRAAGLDAQIIKTEGGPVLRPADDSPRGTDVQEGCFQQYLASSQAKPVLLYLGAPPDAGSLFVGPATRRTALIALAILLVALLMSWWLGRRLARPLERLAIGAGRLESGDLAHRVPDTGADEIGRMGRAFNSLASSLQRNEAARKQMVSDVAHELGNPLVTIGGTLEAINDGIYPADESTLGPLGDEVDNVKRLVRDLQDLASSDAGQLRLHPLEIDLGELVDRVVEGQRAMAQGVSLRRSGLAEVTVTADAGRIRQVLGNLIGNALRHTPEGGTVDVRVSADADLVSVAVSDTGPGIDPDSLDQVFDRLWRADASRTRETGGTGLGLAIADALTRAHGGRLTVDSEVGVGTVFTLELPRGGCTEHPPLDS